MAPRTATTTSYSELAFPASTESSHIHIEIYIHTHPLTLYNFLNVTFFKAVVYTESFF